VKQSFSRHHLREMTATGTSTADARARLGGRLLLGAAAAAVLAVLLVLLAAAVVSNVGWVSDVDHEVADRLHRYVLDRPTLASALGLISTLTHPNVMRLVTAATAVGLWWAGRPRIAVWLVVTMAVGGGLDPVLKDLVARARPSFSDPVALAPGYSFPSGHALNTMLLATCVVMITHELTRGRRALRALVWLAAAALVLVTGFDRIGLGVHYVSDVLAGWGVALVTVLATTVAFERWRRTEGLPPSTTDQGLDPERDTP
jgi:undecaprenyl-diphosphatase